MSNHADDNSHSPAPATTAVHAGTYDDPVFEGANSPIFTSTSFSFLDGETICYPRYFNTPNHQSVATKLARLEGGDAALVFSSGMAAISTTLMALARQGDHVIVQKDIYGGTDSLVRREFERFGIEYSFVAGLDAGSFAAAVKPNTKLIYVETPSNPTLGIVDLEAIAKLARDKGLTSVIDNTFASPVNQRPLEFGIDISLHSGTKYLGGHSDISCGAAIGSAELIDRIRSSALHFGGNLNGATCYLLERSLKTLVLRVQRQSENALVLAHFLKEHANVTRVYYPGLVDHPGHEIARRQMTAFGGVLSFTLKKETARAFMQRLELIRPAISLGGVESIVCCPADTSHRDLPGKEKEATGITEALVRLSVGIEAVSDLERDLARAL